MQKALVRVTLLRMRGGSNCLYSRIKTALDGMSLGKIMTTCMRPKPAKCSATLHSPPATESPSTPKKWKAPLASDAKLRVRVKGLGLNPDLLLTYSGTRQLFTTIQLLVLYISQSSQVARYCTRNCNFKHDLHSLDEPLTKINSRYPGAAYSGRFLSVERSLHT